jgi:hypothetical protein
MRNRRNDERIYVGAQVKVAIENDAELDAILLDYSSAGVGLVLAHSVRRGAPVKLVIGADEYHGVVGRCKRLEGRRGYSIGVELVEKNQASDLL